MDLGTCYFNSNNNEKALEIFHGVIDKNPDHKIGYLNLGVVYYNQNEMDKTKQYWGELIKRFPGDPLADSVKKYIEQLEQHP